MHRDLKADNFMFRDKSNNRLVLIDFGLATKIKETKFIFNKCGSSGYLAPEILNGSNHAMQYDEKCDSFSAGVLLYYM
jgi:calcium/calmodulin-dependent protein kinase I